MTSLAVLPPLKRSITDIMDEELYHSPNTPITNNSTANVTTPLRSDSPKPASLFRNMASSVVSSPAVNHTSLTNSANLSSLLNIPDGFLDHYNRLNGSNNALNDNVDYSAMNLNYENSNNMTVNPFSDYGNPDTQFIQPQQIQNVNVQRRRRITTLGDVLKEPTKTLKDDDYYLFNPDVQPSLLINNDLYSDSSFLVPPPPSLPPTQADVTDLSNYPIPGYENDYLLIDDFEEDVEEELSDDDDDDNYFHDDNDFDDYIMRSGEPAEQFFKPSALYNDTFNNNMFDEMNGGFIDDFGINRNTISQEELVPQESPSIASPEEDDMVVDEDYNNSSPELMSPVLPSPVTHKNAAEISAMNPNHQCDLVNPSTGHPCNKQFSRPYDLIRHQETIHASKKKIFRCVICEGRVNGAAGNGKSKTFSRGDALSRHIKVKHGLGGKDALELINEAKENVEYVSV